MKMAIDSCSLGSADDQADPKEQCRPRAFGDPTDLPAKAPEQDDERESRGIAASSGGPDTETEPSATRARRGVVCEGSDLATARHFQDGAAKERLSRPADCANQTVPGVATRRSEGGGVRTTPVELVRRRNRFITSKGRSLKIEAMWLCYVWGFQATAR